MSKKSIYSLLLLISLLTTSCAANQTEELGPTSSKAIPTPSAEPVAYTGVTQDSADLLETLRLADPEANWVEDITGSEDMNRSYKTFVSKNSCYLRTFPSFQDAVNNDSGSYGDSWTLLGSYAQLGIIMFDRAECFTKLTSVIRFPAKSFEAGEIEVLRPSKEVIHDCLVRHASCFLDEGVQFPSELYSFYERPLKELHELANAGFCQVPLDHPIDNVNPGGLDSCALASDKGGSGQEILISQQNSDASILRIAASTPSTGGQDIYGKFMIYGDGWAVFSYGSTEKQKDLFLEMNKVIKGTLVARY